MGDGINKVALEEEGYEPADWIYMAGGWMSLTCCCNHIAESERTEACQVSEDSSCWSHIGMLLHPAFSIPALVIQGDFIVLFLRSLLVRSVV